MAKQLKPKVQYQETYKKGAFVNTDEILNIIVENKEKVSLEVRS